MADPITVGIGTLIALGSALGGYLAAPRKVCSFHEAVRARLDSGDKKFKTFFDEVKKQGELLARIDERTRMIEDMVKQQKGRF